MANFQTTLLDSLNITDVVSDGSTLTITDHSNYQDYSNLAVSGGALVIKLDSGASTVNNFYNTKQIEILAGTGIGQVRTISAYIGATQTATVSLAWATPPDGTSVFNICQAGHLQSQFADFYKIEIDNPDGTTYLYSSLGDGDAILTTPALSTPPITTVYPYSTGDGRYIITIYSVPTWNKDVTYNLADVPCTYSSAKLYQLIAATSTNDVPSASPLIWSEITDIDDLSYNYNQIYNVVVLYDTQACFAGAVGDYVDKKNCSSCSTNVELMREFWDANELMMILYNAPGLVNEGDWTKVESIINRAKNICSCQT